LGGEGEVEQTQRQGEHQLAYQQKRQHLADAIQAARRESQDLDGYQQALQRVCDAADRVCAAAEDMPALMDEEAQETSQRIMRISGAVAAGLAVIWGILILTSVLSSGWWVAVVFTAVTAAALLVIRAGKPGTTGHRRQRRASIGVPILSLLGLATALLGSSWLAVLAVIAATGAAIFCGAEAVGQPRSAAEQQADQ
jgi:hypothetical protein